MRYAGLANLLFNTPLAIDPAKGEVLASVLNEWNAGYGQIADMPRDTKQGCDLILHGINIREGYTQNKPYVMTERGTAIIPIIGALTQRTDALNSMSGISSYADIGRRINHAAQNQSIRGIVLEVDSPGGTVSGLFDLASLIASAKQTKPIWANTNEEMFSAAYALGSATSRITGPRSAHAGSIGVVMMHMDQSVFDEKRGMRYTAIYAGKHKVDFSSHYPLSEPAIARAQSLIDQAYMQFVGHVSVHRGLRQESVIDTQADIFSLQEAVDLGLVDAIATLSETVIELESGYR